MDTLPANDTESPPAGSGNIAGASSGLVVYILLGATLVNTLFGFLAFTYQASVTLNGLIFGSLAGQFALLAVWAATFASIPLARRLIYAMVATDWLWLSVVVGLAAAERAAAGFVWDNLGLLFLWPLLLLAGCAPPGLTAFLTGRRIVHMSRAETRRAARQFRMRELLSLTAILAVALGLAKLYLGAARPASGPEFWGGLCVTTLVLMFFTFLCPVPAVWAALADQNTKRTHIITRHVLTVAGTFGFWLSVMMILVVGAISTLEGVVFICCTCLSNLIVVLGVLHWARRLGYRLR